jgi:hypothetical protein
MKTLITAIATLGAITTFAGSAFADVSFSIRFGSSPSANTYRNYDSYRSNIYQPTYQDPYYHHHHYNNRSRVTIREVVPNYNYGNSVTYPTNFPTTGSVYNPYNSNIGNPYQLGYPANFPTTGSVYNPYNSNLGDRYIIEQRIIRVR